MNEILTQEKSIYIQISEMIENDILRDILCEEERVPSTNELAKLYAITMPPQKESTFWLKQGLYTRNEELVCLWRREQRK